ncbi:MFS transporter [Fodinicola feengrottensis]
MTEAAVDPAGDTRGTAVNGRAAVVTLTYLGFTLQLLQVGIVPLLPTIGKQLHLGVADTSWLVTSSLLAGAVALAVISRLADLYGKKPMIMVSLALVLAGCLIDCFATSFPLLILGRVLMGAQFPMLALPEAIASDTMPKKRAQLTIGAIHAGNGVGIGGGILLGALVGIHPTAWRSFFVIGIITVVIGMAATGWLVRDSRHRAAGRLDLTGAVLLALSLVGILLGLSKGPTWGWGSPRVVALLVAGVVLLLLWLVSAGRAKNPLIRLSDILKPHVRVPYLMTFLIAFGVYGSLSAVTRLAQTQPAVAGFGYGFTILQTAWFAVPQTIGAIVGIMLLQRLTRRGSMAVSACVGVGLNALSFVAFAVLAGAPIAVLTAQGVYSMGTAIALATTQILIVGAVPASESGVALGISIVAYAVGNSFGSDIVGLLLSAFGGAGGAPTETGFLVSFWVCCGASLLALAIGGSLAVRSRISGAAAHAAG